MTIPSLTKNNSFEYSNSKYNIIYLTEFISIDIHKYIKTFFNFVTFFYFINIRILRGGEIPLPHITYSVYIFGCKSALFGPVLVQIK